MKKYAPTVVMFGLIAAAAIIYFTSDNTLVAFFVAVLAVVVWGTTASGLGPVPAHKPRVSPEQLKEYRRQHPGATIADAIEHAGR